MRYVFFVLVLIAVFGCARRENTADTNRTRSSLTEQTSPQSSTIIPADVTYSIVESDVMPPFKRSLTVQLNRRVSEGVLRAIAVELKARDPQPYDRTFICYYLPGMALDSGAWATTHFDPDLRVLINGLTIEEHKAVSKQTVPKDRTVIGSWIDETPFVGSRVTLFRKGGKLKIEFSFKDGSMLTQDVVEKRSSAGRRFVPVEAAPTGDYWVIDQKGNLEIRDNQGLIAVAPKVE